MLPGDFTAGMVVQLETYAIVNGVRRDIESFSTDRDLSGDLPEQVAATGGISGASGSITWASQEDVQSREPSPWHKPGGWPPSAGDRVRVYVTDGVTSWPRFTGLIDKTTGAVGGGMQSSVIDDRDKLNTSFTHEALLRHHTPFGEGNDYRSIGLNHWYILTAALRKAGLYNTPPMVADIALSAPLQGSVWPEAGIVTSAGGNGGTIHAGFYRADWGYSAASFIASYQPRVSPSMTETYQMTLMIGANHSEDAQVIAYFGTNAADRIRVRFWAGRNVTAYLNNTSVCSLSTAQMQNATTVTLLVKGDAWELRTNAGTRSSGTLTRTSAALMSRIDVTAGVGSRIAGLQVSRPLTTAHEFASLSFTPSMRFTPGNLASTMDMMPRIEGRNVADLVDEICAATLTAGWWDESGVFQLVASDQLRGAASVQTITTLDDITDFPWEDSLLSVRRSVEVTWKDPAISKGRYRRIELFRGSGDSMEAQDTIEVFATPEAGTEWFGVDRSPRLLDDSNWGIYNRKRGSFMGVYYMNASDAELPSSAASTTITISNLGTVALKISHTAGAYGAGVEANLGTSENAIALRPQRRGENLPLIRGYGKGVEMDESTTSSITGPSYAPALVHDLGPWGQRFFDGGSVAQRLGDFIAGMVTIPMPTLGGVGVLYDPRRQLGDVITIDAGILDLTLRALVVGISENHQPGDHEQNLSVRIISATSTRPVTYDELTAAWAGGTYTALQTVWAGLTYGDLANNPLEGAPN